MYDSICLYINLHVGLSAKDALRCSRPRSTGIGTLDETTGSRNASQTASSGFGVKKQQNTPAQKKEMLIENQSNEGSRVRGVATS